MATAITDFYDALRVVLGDRDEEFPQYEDASLLKGVRAVAQMGRVKGFGLTTDRNSIYPDVTDPNVFALFIYHAALMFVASSPDRYSYKTRAIGESFGGYGDFIANIQQSLYELENGTYFTSYSQLGTWMKGMFGKNLWEVMTEVKVEAPWQTVNLSLRGATVATESLGTDQDGSVLFTNVGSIIVGAYLLGEYLATRKLEITTVIVNCKAGLGDVVLTLEIGGVGVGVVTILAGETRVEKVMGLALGSGVSARWRCTTAPGSAPDSISEIGLNMTVSPRA